MHRFVGEGGFFHDLRFGTSNQVADDDESGLIEQSTVLQIYSDDARDLLVEYRYPFELHHTSFQIGGWLLGHRHGWLAFRGLSVPRVGRLGRFGWWRWFLIIIGRWGASISEPGRNSTPVTFFANLALLELGELVDFFQAIFAEFFELAQGRNACHLFENVGASPRQDRQERQVAAIVGR